MTDILLIHGAWHGGWAWDGIADTLRRIGHRVLAPCLEGLGSDSRNLHRDIGLYTHVDQLEALVRDEDLHDSVLVGHSYGGAVVHALEGRIMDRLLAVVHVEGAVPEPGSMVIDLWDEDRRIRVLEAFAKEKHGWRVPPPDLRSWGSLSDDQIAWLEPQLTEQSLKTYRDAMPSPETIADCPHYYVFAEDRDRHPYAEVIERFRRTPGWQIIAATGGHALMVTNPGAVLSVIRTAAESGHVPEEL